MRQYNNKEFKSVPCTTAPRRCAEAFAEVKKDTQSGIMTPLSAMSSVRRGCCLDCAKSHYAHDLPGLKLVVDTWLKDCQGYCNRLNSDASPRPSLLDSGALHIQNVCKAHVSECPTQFRLCQGCRACVEGWAKALAKCERSKKARCIARCNDE
jgi:hypothetical protein